MGRKGAKQLCDISKVSWLDDAKYLMILSCNKNWIICWDSIRTSLYIETRILPLKARSVHNAAILRTFLYLDKSYQRRSSLHWIFLNTISATKYLITTLGGKAPKMPKVASSTPYYILYSDSSLHKFWRFRVPILRHPPKLWCCLDSRVCSLMSSWRIWGTLPLMGHIVSNLSCISFCISAESWY